MVRFVRSVRNVRFVKNVRSVRFVRSVGGQKTEGRGKRDEG